ncbi:hypothetical protein [uncultured Methanobrevibacter sp.]|uniref:hypothetical protein n=1 Tax=uncultured Methanobrevibacter sp. TaxID=253161 RepID=UPI002618F144|nr:hypothetical protein [uncultured Methanobrevibacter sp.]
MKITIKNVKRAAAPNSEPQFENTNLLKLIGDNFKIHGDNPNKIYSFIKKDNELEKIIFDLPNLIKKEFPHDKLQIKFNETELILEVGIFTSFGEKTSFEKEKKLENQLYDNYNWDSADKILIVMEY